MRGARVPLGCAWARGAWWFENWIVDASEAEAVGLRFASIVFRSNFLCMFCLLLFVDRFVILSDVMIWRLGICR